MALELETENNPFGGFKPLPIAYVYRNNQEIYRKTEIEILSRQSISSK